MSLPIKTLPIVERWDCHSCAFCCRSTKFKLSDEDLKKLRAQKWEEHPEFRGLRIVTRHGWLRKYYQLGKQPDGACIFLTEENLCRIHRDLGEAAKPLVCRLFPFQLVPLEKFAYVTLRQYCPSAVAENGRPLEEYLPQIAQLAVEGKLIDKPITLPAIIPGVKRNWDDLLLVAAAVDRLVLDQSYPLVRRLVHGLQFCNLLQQHRAELLGSNQLESLLDELATMAAAEQPTNEILLQPRRPITAARLTWRQILFEYLRLHPDYRAEPTWAERWRLIRGAMLFARGKGRLKFSEKFFPATTFEILEQPLGRLDEDLLHPLTRFFEKATAARQYLLLGDRSWSLVDGFRSLALAHSAALWLLRLSCGAKRPTLEEVFKAVRTIDRGLGSDSLISRRHRRRIDYLNRLGELPRILAWYAR
jgi:lysine-N-methylase